ncbi:MAG: hypothetical protein AAGA81_10495 [Acidobacteriota bacterium]
MVICGSCGQQVEEESTNCPTCGGLVSTLPLALDFAWRYESMTRSERGVEWRGLAKHEREEAQRLLGGAVEIGVPRSRLVVLLLLLLAAIAAATTVSSTVRQGGHAAISDSPVIGQSTAIPAPLLQPLSPAQRVPAVCDGGLALPESAVVTEPTTLYSSPSRSSSAVIRLEQNTLLSVRCRRSDWVRLEVQQPPRLRGSLGWVPVELLDRPPEARAALLRRVDSVLDLGEELRPYRSRVVEALVGLITDVPRCGMVDLGSVALWQRGSEVREFSVVCDPGEVAFNYWFDLEGRELRKPSPLEVSGGSRAEQCREAFVGAASVPGSVLFDAEGAVDVEYPRGVRRFVTTARAADRSGAYRDYRVLCIFEEEALMNWAVAE